MQDDGAEVDLSGATPHEYGAASCAYLASSGSLRGEGEPVAKVLVSVTSAQQRILPSSDLILYSVTGLTTTLGDAKRVYEWSCESSFPVAGGTMSAEMLSFARVESPTK